MPVRPLADPPNSVRQELGREPGSEELRLAEALEALFGQGIHELPGVVAGLNAQGLRAPDGRSWTESSFAGYLEQAGWQA